MFLNCHSYYSLRYSALSVEQLVELAAKNGLESLVLTDINNTTGSLEFVRRCNEKGIKPILGIEFRNNNKLLYVGIAKNNTGFRELNQFLTDHNLSKTKLPEVAPVFDNCYVIYPYGKEIEQLKDNEYFGVDFYQLNKLIYEKHEKFVLLHPVSFANKMGYQLHLRLRAVDNNILLTQLTPEMIGRPDELICRQELVLKRLEQFPKIISNTLQILASCSFTFDFKVIKNKKTFTGSHRDDKQLLEKLAHEGMLYRYGPSNKLAKERVHKELEIIDELGFSSYFLITWDVIRYSMSRGFYHVGRGSGANSVVAYCLKITDVCPLELDLYFERFLNPLRKSPPDFDIDYSWKERDDVIDYIFKRYGKDHVALLGTIPTFKDNSIIRELGKVYGLPKEEIDRLVDEPERANTSDSVVREILSFHQAIQDFPNMRSIHAGGILISEEPITSYVALDMPPKGFQTTQFDMYTMEEIGFEKLDILSQRGIGHIQDAANIIYRNRKQKIDVHDITKFKSDEQVRAQLKDGDSIGCFYIESPAMRGLLKKLMCDKYISLVAASSIIRPGVAKSGMMKEYIKRFHNPSGFTYLHPVMEQQLKETYGVMVFQEDVLKVGHHFGGLDLADADVLRRMMSGKGKSKDKVLEIKKKYFINCKEFGYPEDIAKEVWRQIESFAGYSFSKAHSASYAVESYQSLYLKAHYPIDFMVGVINNFGGFYRTWVYFNEARKVGGNINLPCANTGEYYTTIFGNEIYVGFIHIKSLEKSIAEEIALERFRSGLYRDMEDFTKRIKIGLEQLLLLVKIGAFRFTRKSKKTLLWEAHMLINDKVAHREPNELFYTEPKSYDLSGLQNNAIEDVYDEIELIGFPVTRTRFDILKTDFRGEIGAKEMINHVGKTVRMVGDYVATKGVRTVRGDIMYFGTFLDHKGDFFDTVNFPPSLKHSPFKSSGVYLIQGKIVEEFGFPSMDVERMAKLSVQTDPRYK